MILKVTPTRITLLTLKKDLRVAENGYRLLKNKRDGLMKQFMGVIRETKQLREDVEERIGTAFATYAIASSLVHRKTTEVAFLVPGVSIDLDVSVRNIMSVPVPEFAIKKSGSAFSYGMMETSGDLDNAIKKFEDVITDIIKLAELEKTAENLAEEIERTRRRVSALENTRIPNLKDTIRFITGRLEEHARDAVVSTMRVKAMIIEKETAKQ